MRPRSPTLPLFTGLSVGAVLYVAAHSLGWPVLTYLPVEGTWTWAEPPGAIAMHYYGVVLWGLGGFGLGHALGRLGPIRSPRGLAILTVALVLGALAYYLVRELTGWS